MLELNAWNEFDKFLDNSSIRGKSTFFPSKLSTNLLDNDLGVPLQSKLPNSHLQSKDKPYDLSFVFTDIFRAKELDPENERDTSSIRII